MVLLSEIDPYQHAAVERGKAFNLNNYKARYWLINGRGFPDSIADNGASWLPDQPYGALATVKPYDPRPTRCRAWRATSASAARTTRSTRTATTASWSAVTGTS